MICKGEKRPFLALLTPHYLGFNFACSRLRCRIFLVVENKKWQDGCYATRGGFVADGISETEDGKGTPRALARARGAFAIGYLPRSSFPRGLPELHSTQRLARIKADRSANPQIIHDVEAPFAALKLGNLGLIGSDAGQMTPAPKLKANTL
jgi:hypothetical protein